MRVALVVLIALAVTACKKPEAPSAAPGPAAAVAGAPAAGASVVRGKVVEKIDAAPYSYLKLSGPAGEVWAAVPQTNVATGTEVVIENPMAMDGFESKTLNRKFDKILFGTLGGQGAPAAAAPAGMPPGAMPPGGMPPGAMPPGGMPPAGMAAQHAAAGAGPADVGDVKVPKATGANAKTVAEVHGQKAQLKEKKVTVRGKVVKSNSGIMGKNWLHLRDGSGTQEKGDNDITVTTDSAASVGEVVVVVGVVRLDKDFGAGYAYPVIIEEATFVK
jgi:hypothetical protein